MARTIDHALVMDTDHLPGGGGYAVAGFSEGLTGAERLFAAQNFGISDYLHDPQNARVYFSVFRVPGGRHAFVRRFANGRRRSGVQNRLFVHTLFLDEATLEEVHYLPWLLADATFRVGRGEPMPLTLDVAPLLDDPAFPPLQWVSAISRSHAFEQLKLRADQVTRKTSEAAIGTTLEAMSRGPVALPQGQPWEQLSLVAWSMLPPLDRAAIAWTQHDAGNLAGVGFGVANAPNARELAARQTRHQRIAAMNMRSAEDWSEYQARTREYRLSIGTDKLIPWLEFREANTALTADAQASRAVVAERLQKLAAAVRMDRRDPWVSERAILDFLWTMRAAGVHGTEIGAVAFREPPPRDWLDERAAQTNAEEVVRFFVDGTKDPKTREAIAGWVLERKPKVSNEVMVSLAILDNLGPNVRALLEKARPAWTPAVASAFWRQLDMKDVGSLQPETINTIATASKDVVAKWTANARRLPAHPRSEELLDVLSTTADLRVERAWRELLLNRGTEETVMQLEYAVGDEEEVRAAIARLPKSRAAAERAAELLRIATHRHTLPTTRRIIETDLLPQELGKLRGEEEWLRFLTAAQDHLFVFRNLMAVVARKRGRR